MTYKEKVLLEIVELRKVGVRTPSTTKLQSADVAKAIAEYEESHCPIGDAADLIIQIYN